MNRDGIQVLQVQDALNLDLTIDLIFVFIYLFIHLMIIGGHTYFHVFGSKHLPYGTTLWMYYTIDRTSSYSIILRQAYSTFSWKGMMAICFESDSCFAFHLLFKFIYLFIDIFSYLFINYIYFYFLYSLFSYLVIFLIFYIFLYYCDMSSPGFLCYIYLWPGIWGLPTAFQRGRCTFSCGCFFSWFLAIFLQGCIWRQQGACVAFGKTLLHRSAIAHRLLMWIGVFYFVRSDFYVFNAWLGRWIINFTGVWGCVRGSFQYATLFFIICSHLI